MKTPDFIGIGAQKSGTAWLFNRLREHPEFTLPFHKEFHYFDRNPKYPSPNIFANKYFIIRLAEPFYRKKIVYEFKKSIEAKNITRLKWFLKFYCSTISDNWYLSQFSTFKGITGEFSPSYSILEIPDITKIYRLLPDAKLIFLIRNPIERAWSAYRFFLNNGIIKKSLEFSDIIDFMDSPLQVSRNNYLRTISNYTSVFPANQIILCFYDAIIDQPFNLMCGVVDFLGGNAASSSKIKGLNVKNNVSPKMEIPERVHQYLVDKYHVDIAELSKTYQGYCKQWYHKYYKSNELATNGFENKLPPAFINL